MKIAVTGYSGSGKSTLAKRLSEEFGTPLLYLDSVNFKPGW
ncbi:MAG: (d)CMP kinase [Firmicutes bacterium]|nr:(d)CMP kinase [Bacillota bacterium]